MDGHYKQPKEVTFSDIRGYKERSGHDIHHKNRRRKLSPTALIITAVALALLVAAIIILGTTHLQTSNKDTPSENAPAPTRTGLPPSPSAAAPPGGDQGLSWCQAQSDGNCTLGVHENLDTGQIRAQIFDHTCRPLGSSDHLQVDSATALNSSLPETVVVLIHGVTGPADEFWYKGTHYSDGWVWQNPAPVWYETQVFPCL